LVGRQPLAQRGQGRGLRFVDEVVVDQAPRQRHGGAVHLAAPAGQFVQSGNDGALHVGAFGGTC
jgi:hypothetical protein